MTSDEQNTIDLERMAVKRMTAAGVLCTFAKWHFPGDLIQREGNQLLIAGLARDILRGTEQDVDNLIFHLEERNQQLLMKKLQ